jgi:hypothetical protein
MTSNIPVDIWRHIFEMKLKDEPLFIFNFTREMILLGDYKIEEIGEMIKKSIIRNLEITKVPFFDFCKRRKNQYILESKIFLNYINILDSIKNNHLSRRDYFYKMSNYQYSSDEYFDGSICEYAIKNNNIKLLKWLISKCKNRENICFFAIKHNNLEILRFLIEQNDPFPLDKNCFKKAMYNNNAEIIKYILEKSLFEKYFIFDKLNQPDISPCLILY